MLEQMLIGVPLMLLLLMIGGATLVFDYYLLRWFYRRYFKRN